MCFQLSKQKTRFVVMELKIPVMSPEKRPSSDIRKYMAYSSDSLKKPFNCAKNEGMSVKMTAEFYDINRTTLIYYQKNGKCGPVDRPTILSQEEEQHVVHILIKMTEWGFGMDPFQLKMLIQDYSKRVD